MISRVFCSLALAFPIWTLTASAQVEDSFETLCDRVVAVFQTESSYDLTICQQADGDWVARGEREDGDTSFTTEAVQPLDENSYQVDFGETTYIVTPDELEVWENNLLVEYEQDVEAELSDD